MFIIVDKVTVTEQMFRSHKISGRKRKRKKVIIDICKSQKKLIIYVFCSIIDKLKYLSQITNDDHISPRALRTEGQT